MTCGIEWLDKVVFFVGCTGVVLFVFIWIFLLAVITTGIYAEIKGSGDRK